MGVARVDDYVLVSEKGEWFVRGESLLRYNRAGRWRAAVRVFRRSGGFRMVQFNVGGWVVLLAPGAGAGLLVAYVLGRRRVVGALSGAGVVWFVGLIVDSIRWRASATLIGGGEHHVESLELPDRAFTDADLVPSPGGWVPPIGSRPGWEWVPPYGAVPRPGSMPRWIRLVYRTPVLDRWAHRLMWTRGGFLVLPAGHPWLDRQRGPTAD